MTDRIINLGVRITADGKIAEGEIQRLEKQLGKLGDGVEKSSRQAVAAMRMLPAQMTDIATGLASGQSPFMVLIQQGGQLKDMFGGIGPAARAVGGYVAALVNPFTVAAAAVGGLTAAYLVGAGEAREYQKALILTGNASATTVGRLQGMAEALSQSTGATKALAAEVLTSLVSTAQVTGDTMQRVGEAAIRMERAGVQSIDATVKQFEELGKRPVEASIKLNEQTNFLTAAIYGQIKALNEQGKEAEAAALAQGAYADEMSRRSRQVEDNLGTLERRWIDVKDAAKAAIDAMLDIGRVQSDEARIKELEGYGPHTGSIFTGRTQGQEEELKAARTRVEMRRQEAEQQAKINRETQAAIEWDKIRSPLLDKNKRAEIEIARVRQAGLAARKSELEIEALIAAVREKYAEKGGPKKKADSGFEDAAVAQAKEYERLYTEGEKYRQSLVLQLEAGHELTKGEQLLAEAQRQRGTVQYEILKAQADEILALEKQIKDRKSAADFQKTWTDLLARQRKAMEGEVDSLIDGNKALALHNEEISLSIEALGALNLSRIDSAIALKEEALAQEQAGEADAARIELLRQQIELLKKRRDLTANGFEKERVATRTKEATDQSVRDAERINDALTDALMRGFESGKGYARSFRDSVVNMFKTMVLRPVVQGVVSTATGAIGTLLTGNANASSGGGGASSNLIGTLGTQGINYALGSAGGLVGLSQAFGAGLGLTATEAAAATAAYSAAGYGATASAISAGAAAGGGTAAASALGSALSTLAAAAPYIAAVVALVSAFVKFGGGTPHAGAVSIGSEGGVSATPRTLDAFRALYANPGDADQFFESDFTKRFQQQMADALSPVAAGLAGSFNAITRQYGLGGGYRVGIGFSADGDDKSRGRFSVIDAQGGEVFDFRRRFAKDATEGVKQFGLAAQQGLLQALREMDLGSEVNAVLDLSMKGATDYLTQLSQDQTQALLTLLEQGYLDDLTRNVDLANATWDTLIQRVGQLAQIASLKPIFDSLGVSIVEAGVDIVAAIGGVDQAASALQGYYTQFYSDAERLEIAQTDLARAFGLLDLAVPRTRAEFRSMVESLDLTTASGRDTYAALIKLAPAFAEIDAAAQAAADEQRRLQDAAAQAAQQARQQIRDTFRQLSESLKDFLAGLKTGPLSDLNPQAQYAAARAAFEATGRRAALGDQDAMKNLQSVATTFLEASRSWFASSEGYSRDLDTVEALIERVLGIARRGVQGFASGGIAQGAAIVGEQGPELAFFRQPTRIVSHADSKALLNVQPVVDAIDRGTRSNADAMARLEARIARLEAVSGETARELRLRNAA